MRSQVVHACGARTSAVRTGAELRAVLAEGLALRSTVETQANPISSRSHAICALRFGAADGAAVADGGEGGRAEATLRLVDLAGSERLKNTSASGQRLKEAKCINKSLSALGDVMAALGGGNGGDNGEGGPGSAPAHVPYRNSKLTSLLADSLRANARVLMFANVNPSSGSAGESRCTLNFAARCRNVKLGRSSQSRS